MSPSVPAAQNTSSPGARSVPCPKLDTHTDPEGMENEPAPCPSLLYYGNHHLYPTHPPSHGRHEPYELELMCEER